MNKHALRNKKKCTQTKPKSTPKELFYTRTLQERMFTNKKRVHQEEYPTSTT